MAQSRAREIRSATVAALVFSAALLLTAAGAVADAPAQQKTLLDKPVPGIRGEKPVPADALIEHLQDSASVTITVDWEKLGTRGDKGVIVNIGPMPMRDHINAILKAAGAKKTAKMTVEGTKVHVTAEPEQKK
jgi:hypothetical protein